MEALNLETLVGSNNLGNIDELFYTRYDELIRLVCPDYDEMLDLLVDHLPAGAEGLLDLGCGTGNLMARLAGRRPEMERIVGVDFSRRVLQKARDKLDGEDDRLEFCHLDICKDELPDIPVRASALTLHNLPPAVQMTLYVKILQGARCFLHYDLIRGATREEERERWDYLGWWMTQKEVPSWMQSLAVEQMQKEDQPLTLQQHENLCQSAGMSFSVLRRSPGFVLFKAERRAS